MGDTKQDPHADKKGQTDKNWWQPAVMVFLRMSAWIAVPVLLGTLAGRWLDDKLDSAPWGLISIVGVSFVISMIGLIMETMKEYKKIVGDEKNNKSENIIKTQETRNKDTNKIQIKN